MDESRRNQAWGAMAGGALMLVGSFLPWVSVTTIFGTLTRSGVDGNGDGMISAALGIAAAGIGVALLNRESRAASGALAVIAALAGLLVYVDGSDIAGRLSDLDSEAALASIGIGLWVVGAGALLTGVVGLQGLSGTGNPLARKQVPAAPDREPMGLKHPPTSQEPEAIDDERATEPRLQPPDHGIYRCVSGAKISGDRQTAGQPCPYCGRMLSLTPSVKDNTSRRPLPKWLQVVIAAVVLVAGLALFYATDLDDALFP